MMFSFRLRTPTAGTLSSLSSTASWAALFWPVQCRCPNRPPRPPGPWLDSFSHISCPMMSTIVLFCSHWNPKYSNCSFVEDSPSLTYGTESSPSWRELWLGCSQSQSSFRWAFRNNDICIWNTPIVFRTIVFIPHLILIIMTFIPIRSQWQSLRCQMSRSSTMYSLIIILSQTMAKLLVSIQPLAVDSSKSIRAGWQKRNPN